MSTILPPLLLREASASPAVGAALALLADAGQVWSRPNGREQRGELRVFTLADPASGRSEPPVAAARVVLGDAAVAQLVGLAVEASFPEREIAIRLVVAVADWLRAAGYRRLRATGTPPISLQPVLFAAGFERARVPSADTAERLELAL